MAPDRIRRVLFAAVVLAAGPARAAAEASSWWTEPLLGGPGGGGAAWPLRAALLLDLLDPAIASTLTPARLLRSVLVVLASARAARALFGGRWVGGWLVGKRLHEVGFLRMQRDFRPGVLFSEQLHLMQAQGPYPIVLRPPGRKLMVASTNPEHVRHVLGTAFKKWDKGPIMHKLFEDMLGDGIFNADGADWQQQRKVASHEFSVRSLRDFMCKVFRDNTTLAMELLADVAEGEVNVQDVFARATLEAFGHIGFGVEIGGLKKGAAAAVSRDFREGFDFATGVLAYRFIDPFWRLKRFLNIGNERKMRKSLEMVKSFSRRIISERRLVGVEDLKGRADMLSRFMLYRKPAAETTVAAAGSEKASPAAEAPDFSFTDANLQEIVINFILAGRDTTAIMLSWTVFELAQHPEVLACLRAEAAAVLGPRGADAAASPLSPHPGLTFAGLAKMPYLKAVLSEVLRLHPSVPIDIKQANSDDVLPGGVKIKAGEGFMLMPFAMGRDPKLWAEPTRFDPRRFLHEAASAAAPAGSDSDDERCSLGPCATTIDESTFAARLAADPSQFVFRLPAYEKFPVFLGGPRLCLGRDMAFLGSGIMISTLIDAFDLELVDPVESVLYEVSVTMWIHGGLRVRPRRRE